jgi:transposase
MSLHSSNEPPAPLRNHDEQRFKVIQAVLTKGLSVETAAHRLGLTTRQVYRLRTRAANYGLRGIIHGNRGRFPANKIKQEKWDRIISLARQKYQGLSYYQMQRRLEQDFKIRISRESLRKRLRPLGIGRQRKQPRH